MQARPLLLSAIMTFALFSTASRAARAEDRHLAKERESFIDERRALMIGLSAWSAVNIIGGAVLIATDPLSRSRSPSRRDFRRSFGAMALAYGVINGALALGTLLTIPRQRDSLGSVELVDFQRKQSSTVFAANVGLDVLYVTVGASLWAWGPTSTARGTGAGFVAQGSFLVGFDAAGALLYRY
jgi:hypothetical protein